MGTLRVSASLDQMRRMQVAERGGGECARTGMLAQIGSAVNDRTCAPITEAEANPITCLETPLGKSDSEAGPAFLSESAQHSMSAQQLLLQAAWPGAIRPIHETAETCSGAIPIASIAVNRIATAFRISLMDSTKSAARRETEVQENRPLERQKARRGEPAGFHADLTALSRLTEWERSRPGRRSSGRRR